MTPPPPPTTILGSAAMPVVTIRRDCRREVPRFRFSGPFLLFIFQYSTRRYCFARSFRRLFLAASRRSRTPPYRDLMRKEDQGKKISLSGYVFIIVLYVVGQCCWFQNSFTSHPLIDRSRANYLRTVVLSTKYISKYFPVTLLRSTYAAIPSSSCLHYNILVYNDYNNNNYYALIILRETQAQRMVGPFGRTRKLFGQLSIYFVD